MKLTSIFKQSTKALLANKGRTFLTILGIIIGIGSVIGLVSLGEGVQQSIEKQVRTLGSTNLIVSPGEGFPSSTTSRDGQAPQGPRNALAQTQTLTQADLDSLREISDPSIKQVSGTISGTAIFTINEKSQRKVVNGVLPAHFLMQSLDLQTGRLFDDSDNNNTAYVAVLGATLAQDLFGTQSPISQEITIQGNIFTVVGVLKERAASAMSNPNTTVFIPAMSAKQTFNVTHYSLITVQASSESSVEQAKNAVETVLLKNHSITDKALADFSVSSSKDLLSTVSEITGLVTALLAGIAAISLVVGGIGIMNIMLVAVTERTREIGLRKAVGAKTFDILMQFIIESVLLTLIGGLIGIALGYGIGILASRLAPQLQPVVTLDAILLAVGISSGIGILFGVYPAARAAQLNPIDALRYE